MLRGKKHTKTKKDSASRAIVSSRVKDYGNDPFFVQKAEASKKVIEKYGFPKELLTERK